jgi:hypothetical protein
LRRILRSIILLFFLTAPAGLPLSAQTGGDGDNLVIKLAVMGPGDELYFWWGHIGIIIEDRAGGKARFYDWGIFSFENENFFYNFAMGRLLYTCGSSSPERNINSYIETNRDITLYTLDLPPDKKAELKAFAEWNVQPENRDYYYHHFRDNCATRVRDILDTATGGAFKEKYGSAPGRFTYRQNVRRHTWFNPFFDWFLNFLMGQDIDTPTTVWEEMFLPSEIGSRANEFTYTGPNGAERKLVSHVEVLNKAVGRPRVLETPRRQWPRELAFSCLIAAALGFLLFLKHRERAGADTAWALSQGALGFFFGGAGALLFFMTFFTNHDYTYHNINIIFANPLLIGALPLGILYITGKSGQDKFKYETIIKSLWSYVAVFAVISMLLKVLPWFYQQNQVDLALVLPFALILSWLPDGFAYVRREYLWRWLN